MSSSIRLEEMAGANGVSGWEPRFPIGTWVKAPDCNNYGIIVEVKPGEARPRFTNPKDGNLFETKWFREDELQPATGSTSGVTSGMEPSEVEALFTVHYLNPASPPATKPEAHIDGLLYPGYTNASGPPKTSKKTWYFLGVALSVHTGVHFLKKPARQGECAWLQLDMAEYDFQSYAEMLARGMKIPLKPMPYFFCGLIDLVFEDHWSALARKLEELKTTILFVDSSRAVASVNEMEFR